MAKQEQPEGVTTQTEVKSPKKTAAKPVGKKAPKKLAAKPSSEKDKKRIKVLEDTLGDMLNKYGINVNCTDDELAGMPKVARNAVLALRSK